LNTPFCATEKIVFAQSIFGICLPGDCELS
jgi:hypothetical protein